MAARRRAWITGQMQAMRHRTARLLSLFLGILTLAAAITDASADSPFCARLQAQYSALSPTTQDSYQTDRVRAAYENVRNQARAAGCLGIFSVFTKSRQCPAILARLRQVQADYARVGGNLGFLGFGQSGADFERQRLRDMLQSYGCSIPLSGGFRTVCVRACDGYYFPMSFSTNRGRFDTDRAICQAIYPQGEAELYVYQNPGEEAENMVSVDGEPYASKPFAFAYRANYSPACAAQLSSGLAALAKASRVTRKRPLVAGLLPPPRLRPLRGEDPETIADAEGGLDLDAGPLAGAKEVADLKPNSVRTVGPSYYYATPIHLDTLGKKPAKPALFSIISPAEAAEKPAPAPEP